MRFGPLIIAVVLALVAGFIALKMIGGSAEPVEPVVQTQTVTAEPTPTGNVYIASQFIPIGTVLTQDMLMTQPWPSNLVSDTFVTDAQPIDLLVGKIARTSFQNGEPISLTKLAGAGEGSFLAGALPKGMRAVTINTDETLGVAGFVFPGDRVDILMTHPVPKYDAASKGVTTEQVTETLLSNVPVLAVDQIANAQEVSQEQQNNGDAASTIHVARTATLMVNPIDGEKLRLGEKIGQLSMALRSVEDRDTVDMAALLRYQNITQFPLDSVGGTGEGTGDGVRVIRGIDAASVSPVSAPNTAGLMPMIANPMISSPVLGGGPGASAAPAVATPSTQPVANVPAVPEMTPPAAIEAPAPLPAPPSVTTVPAATQ